MKIYNRYGQKLFESAYLNYGWDGTVNFKPVDTGTYIYIVEGSYLDSKVFFFKGNVTLIR
jgi:trimeric autotransporter adhesin